MSVNGVQQPIDAQGTKPVIIAGRTLVPIRAIIEALGGSAAWDAAAQKVTVILGDSTLSLRIGSSLAVVNGSPGPIDAANPAVVPVITNGRTMLPLRFVAESLGIDVQYEATTKMIALEYTKPTLELLRAPVTTTPYMGVILTGPSTVFNWWSVGADYYQVRIFTTGTNPGTGTVFISENIAGTSTSYSLKTDTLPAGSYSWQIRAGNGAGWSVWSEASLFQIGPPPAPILISPKDYVPLTSPVTLVWSPVSDADMYRVRILEGGAEVHASGDISATSYRVPVGILSTGTYNWVVAAHGAAGWGAWSDHMTFATAITSRDGLIRFLSSTFGECQTSLGPTKFGFEVFENTSILTPYDYEIEVRYDVTFFYDLQYSNKITTDMNHVVCAELKQFQEELARAAIVAMPDKKLKGGYSYWWYTYPTIRVDLNTRDYYTWVNYSPSSILTRYGDARITGFSWTPFLDDHLER